MLVFCNPGARTRVVFLSSASPFFSKMGNTKGNNYQIPLRPKSVLTPFPCLLRTGWERGTYLVRSKDKVKDSIRFFLPTKGAYHPFTQHSIFVPCFATTLEQAALLPFVFLTSSLLRLRAKHVSPFPPPHPKVGAYLR